MNQLYVMDMEIVLGKIYVNVTKIRNLEVVLKEVHMAMEIKDVGNKKEVVKDMDMEEEEEKNVTVMEIVIIMDIGWE